MVPGDGDLNGLASLLPRKEALMLGDSISITISGSAKVMKKINQDSYSAEYLLREATGEYRLKVRHSTEKGLVRGEVMDRHNVELTAVIYGTAPDDGYSIVVSSTLRNPQRIAGTDVDALSDGLADWLKANATLLVGWES